MEHLQQEEQRTKSRESHIASNALLTKEAFKNQNKNKFKKGQGQPQNRSNPSGHSRSRQSEY